MDGAQNPLEGLQKTLNFIQNCYAGRPPIRILQTPTLEAHSFPNPFKHTYPLVNRNNIPWLYKTSDFIPHGNSDAASFICYLHDLTSWPSLVLVTRPVKI